MTHANPQGGAYVVSQVDLVSSTMLGWFSNATYGFIIRIGTRSLERCLKGSRYFAAHYESSYIYGTLPTVTKLNAEGEQALLV